MAELNWGLFVAGMFVGGLLSYSVCELIFPVKGKK
jgi:hypothetical protein